MQPLEFSFSPGRDHIMAFRISSNQQGNGRGHGDTGAGQSGISHRQWGETGRVLWPEVRVAKFQRRADGMQGWRAEPQVPSKAPRSPPKAPCDSRIQTGRERWKNGKRAKDDILW